jgi:flavin reductase (DIM6/NTAB) family NADH-FMN oxidoreductase RutF
MATPGVPVGPFPPGADHDTYDRTRRRVLWMLPMGLYVLGSRSGERRNLMTINWVMQISVHPNTKP